MTPKLILILTFFLVVTSCDNVRQNDQTSRTDSDTTKHNLTSDSPDQFEINCDSIYKDQGITLRLVTIDNATENESQNIFTFIIYKQQNGQQYELFRDIVQSTAKEIKFADFNNDNVKDILVQNISDVRSNWTYYLYIVDNDVNTVKK